MSDHCKLNCGGKELNLGSRTHLMGIVNCTPDSFYSASRHTSVRSAVKAGVEMVKAGADFLDIGGESTRPGAKKVSAEEEIRRVVPVIKELSSVVDVPLSVDTYKSKVARLVLEAGASMINDISALQFDPEMAAVAAEFEVPVVLMHIKGTPQNMQNHPEYENVIDEIVSYFERRIEFALSQGIKFENIILDPGIGFGKRLQDNYQILRELAVFKKMSRPILVGISRKSFIGRVLGKPPEESLAGSMAASTLAILNSADILRVHDVKPMKEVVTIADQFVHKMNHVN
ncbi:MAG: dihydropteroate synthase [bacterium]